MNCSDVRRNWNLYHDSEGDSELYDKVNDHLASCPHCELWFEAQSRVEDRICGGLKSESSTPELWSNVLAGSGLQRSASASHRFFLPVLLAMAASVLMMAGAWFVFVRPDAADLAEVTAVRHREMLTGSAAVEFASQSDLEVEKYLRSRVTFPVRCPPREDAGFHVDGAGVCRLADDVAAYLVGRVDETTISIFVLPQNVLASFPRQHAAIRRDGTHRCRRGPYTMVMAQIDRNIVLVVGETDAPRLVRVLNAYGTYHDSHHG